MKRKSRRLFTLTLLLLLGLCLALTAQADREYCNGSNHPNKSLTSTVAPTCTESGVNNYVCPDCEAVFSETIPAKGHTPSTVPGTPATCTAPGRTEGSVCSVCGAVLTAQQEIPATGHSWDGGTVTTAPGCTTDGVRTYTCTRCGATYTESIPATGHTPVTVSGYAATCETPGKTDGSQCSVCGAVLTAQQDIAATGHSWTDWQVGVEPTCEEKGKDYRYCRNCGQTVYWEKDALGHDWDEGVKTGAGYLEDCEITYTCRRDPSHTKTETVPASVTDDAVSISLFMGKVRGNPPKDPGTLSEDPLVLVKDAEDTALPEDGSGAKLSVEVSGGNPPYSYTWIRTYDIKGEEVLEFVGGNEPVYPAEEPGIYYCSITDSLKKTILLSSSVYVYEPLFIWHQPENTNLQTYDVMSCGVDGGVPPYSYKWRKINKGEFSTSPVPDAPDEECINPAFLNVAAGTAVYCVVTDKLNNKIESDPAKVYSAEPMEVTCAEPMLYLRKGEKAEFGAFVTGGVPPYTGVWMDSVGNEYPTEQRDDGGFYMTETSYGGYASFWFLATDSMGKNAHIYTAYDYRQLTITQQPEGCVLPHGGGEHTMTIAVEGGVEPYRFLLFCPVGDNQVQEGNFNTCSFTVTEPGWYDLYIEDAEGNYAYSDTAIVEEYDTLRIAEYTDFEGIMEPGGYATLSVTAESGEEPYSYSWELVEHGPYEPSLFRETETDDAPSIHVYEPGAVYACTVTDANGDTATVENMRVTYAGPIWVLENPKNQHFQYKPDGTYTVSLDCLVISVSDDLSYQWFAKRDGGGYPITIVRGPYGGQHYEFTGDSKQIGGYYYCQITDPLTGEKKNTRDAKVSIAMTCSGAEQEIQDLTYANFTFHFEGGVAPYTVTIRKVHSYWKPDSVDSVSPYTFQGEYYYKANGTLQPETYTVTVRDAVGQICEYKYQCSLSDEPGVPAKITLEKK